MKSTFPLEEKIELATKQAYDGCGQSDVLFESRLQAAYRAILASAPTEQHAEVEAALVKAGFNPHFQECAAAPGACSETGIDVDWCPCGRHP